MVAQLSTYVWLPTNLRIGIQLFILTLTRSNWVTLVVGTSLYAQILFCRARPQLEKLLRSNLTGRNGGTA